MVDLRKQVWAGVVPCGPDGVELTGTFQVASTLAYQDSIGQAVLQCCRVIPDGVLLFLPSYSLMERLEARWKVRREAGQKVRGLEFRWRARRERSERRKAKRSG